ncbi:hypothetical protein BJ878DRAFT_545913 [Calycina marina]|uniref:Xylanolytic transcriptional activator regulatory domain-containing protein n=1 Tax=Calycina marina TaxID=1763456 RepID=A0A9P7YVI4_9HELO|nr:hypothetical protein BJ878DRAFT_545913 [Calycina marina]
MAKDGYDTIDPQRSPSLSRAFSPLSAKDVCEDLIELYFRHIHVSFHFLFHQPSFLASFRDGSLPEVLFFGAIGLSARFSKHQSFASIPLRERGTPYTQEAERRLNLHSPSIVTIQTCMLLGAAAVSEGDSTTESIYFSIACRMAMLLDLPNAHADTCIEQEINNRVWWTVYASDTWSSTGVRLPRMMPHRDVPLPMSESTFLQLSPDTPPYPEQQFNASSATPAQAPHDSLLAHWKFLDQRLSQIDEVNTKAVSHELHGFQLLQTVESISLEMESWASSLPVKMRNTAENLTYWTKEGFGHIFVLLHVQYLHFSQLLFYQFLHRSTDSAGHTSVNFQNAQKCRQHATDLCNLIHLARENPLTDPLYSIAGHILTIASTVQLHILLFSSHAAEVQEARQLLERNFEFLTILRTYWSCLDASFSRFDAFHRACLRRQDDSHFQMDRWMLKFMLEFAEPVNDRAQVEDDEFVAHEEWSLASIGI